MHSHRWNSSWTEERVEKLKQLVGEKLSARLIADQLGCTRNAVIGKCHRLGLSGRPIQCSPRKRGPRKPKAQPPLACRPHPAVASVASPVRIEKPIAFAALSKGYLIDALTARTCRWIDGDPRHQPVHYCGRETLLGTPWCAWHYSRVYQGRASQVDFDRTAEKVMGKVPNDGRILVEAA